MIRERKFKKRILRCPVSARSKVWVCGRSLSGTAGSNPEFGVSECDREASKTETA